MISFYLERQALKRPVNAKSSRVQVENNISKKIMKQIANFELTSLFGGRAISSCEEVQYMASTHVAPFNPSPAEQAAEDKFWANWLELFDRYCR